MAYNDWNEVIKTYEFYASLSNKIYSEHAKAILTLIPTSQSELQDWEYNFGTSHSTLFLRLVGSQTEVSVWGIGKLIYEIYTLSPNDEEVERKDIVSFEEVIPTIKSFLCD